MCFLCFVIMVVLMVSLLRCRGEEHRCPQSVLYIDRSVHSREY